VPTAARAARTFVREVCRAWRLDAPDATVVDRAVLVANELVANAVIHAHSDLWLRLELRADRLFVAVRDRGPKVLQPVPPAPEAGGCGWWSSWAGPGGSTPLPTAARPSGAPSPSALLLPPSPREGSRRRRDP
jgi:hypothetical protein